MKKCCCGGSGPVDVYSRVVWFADPLTPQVPNSTNQTLSGSGIGGSFAASINNVTPGNIIEVDFNVSWLTVTGDVGTYNWTMSLFVAVSFSNDAIPPFPASYVKINESTAYAEDEVTILAPANASGNVLSGKGAIVVPPGATKATVSLVYTDTTNVPSGNTFSAGQMRITEYAAVQSPSALPFTTSPV